MLRSGPILTVALLILLAVSCSPSLPTSTPAPILTEEPSIPVTGAADVQSVEIQVTGTEDFQVNAILRGQLHDSGCTTISSIDQVLEGNTIKLTVTTTSTNDPAVSCAQVLTPFERVVPLDVSSLPAGNYVVDANGVEQTFEIPVRDRAQFSQALVEALNARDYEKLKGLMDETFMIAYWQSEGTANTPDQAVEQLRRNLLNSSSPIAADSGRDLAALLGMDPVKIVGPDVVDASPMLTTGWGAQGRDEAILFIARRPDGGWYWYGLLFAMDGFARPTPVVPTRPVDTNAYQTDVKYVMAQQDVNIRSGPGTQFSIIGFVAEGQIAKVTGVNADKTWWRVICPDNSVGSCWVSALSSLTKPSDGPLPDPTAYPTNVQFVMAQKDVTMYSGPSSRYSSIGFIAGGQTARVTGVNADKTWWRVICPDGSVANCWVSADPAQTRPVDPVAKADVQSVEVQILESYPLQVNAIARGYLPDLGCTTIDGASQQRNGNTFTILLTTRKDPMALCAQMMTPFEYVIPLDIGALVPGHYIVDVNGVEASFDLPNSTGSTNVQYVMALQDISIYSGPGGQNSVIGSVANGQVAKVTGASADGGWWRVICPDDTAGSCWVSADPGLTQPANAPGS